MNSRAVPAPTSRVGAASSGWAGWGHPGAGLEPWSPGEWPLLRWPSFCAPQAPSPHPSDPCTPCASFQRQLPPRQPKPAAPAASCLDLPGDSPGLHAAPSAQALCAPALLAITSSWFIRHPIPPPTAYPPICRGDPVSPDLSVQTCPCIWK